MGNMEFLLGKIGIPKRYWKARLSHFNDQKLSNFNKSGNGLFVYGPVGTGKTHLMSALAIDMAVDHVKENEYPDFSKLPVFISFPDLLMQIKETYRKNSGSTERQVIDKFSRYSILMIDDVGAETLSDWIPGVFGMIIDKRYSGERKTLISSNLDLNQIGKLYDDRIASRINEMTLKYRLDGDDRRVR